MQATRTTTALAALATLAALGLAAPAAQAQDVINFDNFPNQPPVNFYAPLSTANGNNSTFDGVTFSSNASVLGDQFGPAGSPLVKPSSGHYAFGAANTQTTTLMTTKTLYGLDLGLINDANPASSVTINALGLNGLVLGSLTDTLSSTTLSYFNTSSLAALAATPGFTGYSLVSSGSGSNNYDFAGDDFTFTAPVVTPPAVTYAGTFDFDTDSVGTGTNPTSVHTAFSDTSGNVTASFSTTADSAGGGGFVVQAGNPIFTAFSGNYLYNIAPSNLPLSIAFNQALTQGSLAVASNGSGTLTVQELFNGVAVGTATYTPANPNAGTFAFNSAVPFNGLKLSDTAPNFAIDNLNVSSAPEPSQTAALGLGILGLAGLALKARKRRAGGA